MRVFKNLYLYRARMTHFNMLELFLAENHSDYESPNHLLACLGRGALFNL